MLRQIFLALTIFFHNLSYIIRDFCHEVHFFGFLAILDDDWLGRFVVVSVVKGLRNFVLRIFQFELFHVRLNFTDLQKHFLLLWFGTCE